MNTKLNEEQLLQLQQGNAAIAEQFEFGLLFAKIDVSEQEPALPASPAIILDKFATELQEPFQFYKPYSKLFHPKI